MERSEAEAPAKLQLSLGQSIRTNLPAGETGRRARESYAVSFDLTLTTAC